MRKLLLAGAILAAGSALPTTVALAADQHTGLNNFVCHPAIKPGRRVVGVSAVMRPIPGTVKLSMRFQLYGTKSGRATPVRGGDLGKWISPHDVTLGQQPADVWVLKHPVSGVPVGSTYRFQVSFRWIGPGGSVIGASTRTSPKCWQPDMRPDLAVRSISVASVPGDPSLDQYVVWIANNGLTAAGGFAVAFTPGGGEGSEQTATFPQLGSHRTVSETFTGPACTSSAAPTVTVDPAFGVADANRDNNTMTASCPPP